MTEQRRTALRELQNLDLQIREAKERIHEFDPRFIEVEEPALVLESEAEKTRTRLKEMKLEERRLVASVDDRRAREKRLDERLGSVRNLREEAAVSAELEMIKRALQADEQEAYTLIDQIRKTEERLEEVDEAIAETRGVVEPQMAELIAERDAAQKGLASFESERESFANSMDESELRLYDGIRRGGRAIAVAELTEDGACGHCFGVVPLQVQNEVLHGDALIRCEGCGVILAAPDLEAAAAAAEAEAAAQAEAAKAAEEAAAAEAAAAEDVAEDGDTTDADAADGADADAAADADTGADAADTESSVDAEAADDTDAAADADATAADEAAADTDAAADADATAADEAADDTDATADTEDTGDE